MKNALRELLNDLEKIDAVHREIHDTAVFEKLSDVIDSGFIDLQPDYEPPMSYAMFSDEVDALIHTALLAFLHHPEVIAASVELATAQERLDAFQDDDVQSSAGSTYDDYFASRPNA